ncbi:MAG: M56 family metallopeptidase [Lachnospiraceae bacterium]|nr:M56 family metallopeptidase [Lachnospiraceae bacterium]
MGMEILNHILQMNLIGVYGIVLAFLLRPLLRKAGSRYCYSLWIIVFLNLAVPTVLTGSFSLIPRQLYQVELSGVSQEQETGAESKTGLAYNPENDEYSALRNGAVDQLADGALEVSSDVTGADETIKMSERIWSRVLAAFGGETIFVRCLLIVWVSVMMILFAMEGVQYLKMRRRLNGFPLIEKDEEKRLVTLQGLDTPLLFGFLKPTVYLPDSLNGEERAYIIRHELYHRKRRDNIVKAVVLCVAIVYWYNPLVWLAFHFFGVDMELSCDEAVLLKSDSDIKKAYAGSLLKYGALQNHYILTSLTFGEPGLRARIKNVLNFKKRGMAITLAAVLAIGLLAVGLLVRPSGSEEDEETLPDRNNIEEIISNIEEETYCQLLDLSGYQVLLVADQGVYDTGNVEYGTCSATVYFPYIVEQLSASSTSCILQYDGESIYLPERDGSITKYSLDSDGGGLTVEVQSALVEVEDDVFEQELTLSEEELAALEEISFVMRKELWTEETGFVTQEQSGGSEDAAADPLAHTAEQILQLSDILTTLDEDDYCQILSYHGYSVLLVSNYGTYDAGRTDHAEISAEVYFPNTEETLASMGTAYPLRYGVDGIHVEWNTGVHTIYSLDEGTGDLVTEDRELSTEEAQAVYDIPFVTKAELLKEAGVTEEELEAAAKNLELLEEEEASRAELEAATEELGQKESLEYALAQTLGEPLTMETLMELLNGGYSAMIEFDFASCENAVLNYPESTGTLNYWYEFSLEYGGVDYTFRASYYKEDNSLDMLYISDDAGTEDLFCLRRIGKGGANDYAATPEGFESYLQKTADKSAWSLEMFLSSVDLPDGYTFGSWDPTIGYTLDSSAAMSGGVLIKPVAYELQEGYEEEALVADWQYCAGFFAVIGVGCWSWDGDTLIPGFSLGNHMVSAYVEMVDGTAKTAYLLEVEYDMYTSSTEGRMEESGVNLNEIDTVSKYWYIIFVDDGAGATTGYCLGLAKNQFTKEEAISIAQSAVFVE